MNVLLAWLSRWLHEVVAGWVRFWFETPDTRALELVRIGVGVTLFASYLGQAAHLKAFYTEQGWMPLSLTPSLTQEWTSLSVLFLGDGPAAVWLLYMATLASALAYALGWRSNVVKFVLFVGHYSFTRRAPAIAYGVDDLCSNLLFIQCLIPMGHALSFDARRFREPKRWHDLARSIGLRLIQVQLVIIMGFAGLEKLQGEDWWDGLGIWFAMTDWEFNFVPLRPLAEHPWLINVLSYGSVLFELGYGFLIWGRRTRTPMLLFAVALHVGVAATMGLWLFSIGMIAAHLAFAPRRWLDALGRDECEAQVPNGFS